MPDPPKAAFITNVSQLCFSQTQAMRAIVSPISHRKVEDIKPSVNTHGSVEGESRLKVLTAAVWGKNDEENLNFDKFTTLSFTRTALLIS